MDREEEVMWRDRKNALASGWQWSRVLGWSTDSAPVSIPELVYETSRDIKQSGLVSAIVGHVGDGKYFISFQLSTRFTHAVALQDG